MLKHSTTLSVPYRGNGGYFGLRTRRFVCPQDTFMKLQATANYCNVAADVIQF